MTKEYATWVMFLTVGWALNLADVHAIPPSPEAIQIARLLEALMRRPFTERRVTSRETEQLVRSLNVPTDASMAAALVLAWADDTPSAQALQRMVQDGNNTARFALRIRELRRSEGDYFQGLCQLVRTTTNEWELIWYAACLFNDFGERGLEVILEAAERCPDEFVQGVLLAYVATTESPELARKALERNWKKKFVRDPTASIEALLRACTPDKVVVPWREAILRRLQATAARASDNLDAQEQATRQGLATEEIPKTD